MDRNGRSPCTIEPTQCGNNLKNEEGMSIQYKILFGYFISAAVIGSMVAVLFHERRRVQEIEKEAMEVWQVQHDISTVQRHITILGTYGETALAWDKEDLDRYHLLRLHVDSMLQAMHGGSNEFVSREQIDTLRCLLASKEEHLCQIMQLVSKQEESEDLLFSRLYSEARPHTVTRKKKGIAGLFGAKETVQVPTSASATLQSLNTRLYSMQQERRRNMDVYADSLRNHNKNLNRRLLSLINAMNDRTEQVLETKERQLKASHEQSLFVVTWLVLSAVMLLAFSYLIIQRDLKQKARGKMNMEKLIKELCLSVQRNEELIASRKKAMHTVTHELRTPLAAITGYAELMEKEHDAGKIGLYVQNIRQSSARMREMLNALLSFFRLDNGKEQPKFFPCRISAITRTLETEFMPAAMGKGLVLTVRSLADAVVLTDRERILQIGNNLLSNAVKFTESGSVSLTADYGNGILTLVVEDTGTGMTEAEQGRVFGAFERLANAATKDGFGLGLSIVRHIVSMLGGSIRLESERGKGSRFTVEIPMHPAGELPEQAVHGYARRDDRYHDVVAIDNDEVLLLMLKEMYAQEGIHCDTCTNAAELIELIRKKEYSLLLTDLNMPDINGFELLELLRTSNVGNSRDIPVVVTTASGSCSKEELMDRGFSGCLLKPFSISELMEVSDKCAMKSNRNEKPDFTSLLSYGNEAVMLEKLIAETEKEMQAVREAEQRKDLQELDALTHHLRSSWEILRADQPLRELYKLLHGSTVPDHEALSNAVTAALDMGSEIIRLAKEERRKYNNG